MEKVLYIVRGIPGSGKSTFAKSLGGRHFEADMFFVDENGDYNFDPSNIKDAHKWCQNMVNAWMFLKAEKIVVSNTFTQDWEMEPYFDLAKKNGYKVFTIVVENRHGGVNEHGVPDDKLEQMRNRFELKL